MGQNKVQASLRSIADRPIFIVVNVSTKREKFPEHPLFYILTLQSAVDFISTTSLIIQNLFQ